MLEQDPPDSHSDAADLDPLADRSSPPLTAEDHPALRLREYRDLLDDGDSGISLGEVVSACRRARTNGERVDPCGSAACPRCLGRSARQVGGAIAFARPTVLLTVTNLPSQWTEIRPRMNALLRVMRSTGSTYGWAYNIEANPGRPGCHAHCWVRGPLVDADCLDAFAARARVGLLHQVPTTTTLVPLGYGLKDISRSLALPVVEGLALQANYLHRNGGRVVHSTLGYWLDRSGQPIRLRSARILGLRLAAQSGREAAA